MCILSLSLGLTTYSEGKNTGYMMTDALERTQTQHAGAIENYIIPGDHRRVKRSPINPNFPIGKAGLKVGKVGKIYFKPFLFFPPTKPLAATGLLASTKLVPLSKKNIVLG